MQEDGRTCRRTAGPAGAPPGRAGNIAGAGRTGYFAGMVVAAFVAPYLLDATTRFAEAAARRLVAGLRVELG